MHEGLPAGAVLQRARGVWLNRVPLYVLSVFVLVVYAAIDGASSRNGLGWRSGVQARVMPRGVQS